VILPRFEKAREEAASPELPDGPFRGVPLLLKDLGAHLAGDPCHSGMQVLKDANWTEAGESHFAGRLRRAGFVCLGRTNTPELGLLPTTEPAAYPPTRNPWNPDHSSGGSSGGSAAAVAAGMVAVAHASDGGGSIRIPAAHCGLVGLKPTRGRCSFGPDLGERWSGFSCEGFVTRTLRDTAALLDVVAGPEPGDPYVASTPRRPFAEEVGADPGRLRIGFMARGPRSGELHPECGTAVRQAARVLEGLGHAVEESHPEALDDPKAVGAFLTVISSNEAFALDQLGERLGRGITESEVEPLTWAVAQAGRQHGAAKLLAAIDWNHAFARRVAAWWTPADGSRGFDLLLTPTTGEPAPPLGEFAPKPGNPLHGFMRAAAFSMFTSPFNVTGQPGISLPLHETPDGLPVGIQLVAPCGREDVLLQVAAQLEAAQPWRERRPPLHA
jgi:amidase